MKLLHQPRGHKTGPYLHHSQKMAEVSPVSLPVGLCYLTSDSATCKTGGELSVHNGNHLFTDKKQVCN